MTGMAVLLAGIGLTQSNNLVLTVGSNGSGTYGYDSGNFGAVVPQRITIFKGASLVTLDWFIVGGMYPFPLLGLTLAGDQTAVVWTSVTINGTVYALASSGGASYSAPYTYVSWVGGSNPFGTTPGAQIPVVFS